MRFSQRASFKRSAMCGVASVALLGLMHSAAIAKDAQGYVESARSYGAKGDFKAAEIELRNAVRQAPQDPQVHSLLAQVYLSLGEFASAEREARSARDLKGDEADYVLTLGESMLRQGKFADIPVQVKPGTRPPELEAKVRVLLAAAAAGLGDSAKAEVILREAIPIAPKAAGPKLALARQLLGSKPEEAAKFADEVLQGQPRLVDAIVIKGETLAKLGDADAALQRFNEALSIEPNNVSARLSRANVNLRAGDYAAVEDDIDPVLKSAPQNFAANYLRALENFKKRDFSAAEKILDRLSSNFPNMPEGYYVLAATKYGLGQYGQAADAIARYVARVPDNPLGPRLAAMIAVRRGAPESAVNYLQAYLSKAKPDAATLTLLGNTYAAMRKPAQALEQYQKAAALEPENLSLKAIVAASEVDTGAGRKGLEDLEAVFASDAGAPIAGPTLVLTDLRAGRVEKAAIVSEELVKRDPKNQLYQMLLGLVRTSQRDYPEAEAIFKRLTQAAPDFAPAQVNLAQVYRASGKPAEAKKIYEDLLARKPNEVSALLGLADVAAGENRWEDAIRFAEQARTAAPSDPAPGLKLLGYYFTRQDWGRAKPLASELAVQFPSDVGVLDAHARVLAASGEVDRAIEVYRHAYELAPSTGPIFSRYLSLLAAAKRFPEYRTVLQSRVDVDPSNRGLKAQLIRVEAEIGGLDAGLAKAESFAKQDPDSSIYDVASAELYEKSGRRSDAIALLEKAVLSHPGDNAAPIALSGAYARAGDLAKAEAVLKTRLIQKPDGVEIRTALADFYIKNNKIEPAISEETRVLSERPEDPAALNNLAWLYQQSGNLEKARELAERAAALAPGNGSIADTFGWILLAQGETEKALNQLQTASTALPSNPEIRYHLAVALDRAGRSADARTLLEQLLSSGSSFTSKADAEKLLDQLKRG